MEEKERMQKSVEICNDLERTENAECIFPAVALGNSNKRTLLGGHCFRIRLLHLTAVKDLIYAE